MEARLLAALRTLAFNLNEQRSDMSERITVFKRMTGCWVMNRLEGAEAEAGD